MGNIDVMVLITNDKAHRGGGGGQTAIARPAAAGIYHSDHSIAPGVRWESLQF